MSIPFRTRMLGIVDDLKGQGVSPYTSAPPLYRLAWRMGLNVPPPFYCSFLANAFAFAFSFAVLLTIVQSARIAATKPPQISFADALTNSLVGILLCSLFFGLAMAIFVRRRARMLKLPPLA